jgi:hypothetical protein
MPPAAPVINTRCIVPLPLPRLWAFLAREPRLR